MPDHYTYRVTWSMRTGVRRTVAEFPSLSWLDQTRAAALGGMERLVAQVVQDMKANGEPMPSPIADRNYSGKFQVRISPQLHRQLVTEAAEQGVSLNHLVTTKLATGESPRLKQTVVVMMHRVISDMKSQAATSSGSPASKTGAPSDEPGILFQDGAPSIFDTLADRREAQHR